MGGGIFSWERREGTRTRAGAALSLLWEGKEKEKERKK